MAHAGESALETSAQSELVAALDRQPFGDPQLCAAVARRAIMELQQVQDLLASRPVDVQGARRFLAELAEVHPSRLVDYHSARQVVWAMRQVSAELAAMKAPLPNSVETLLFSTAEDDVIDGISTKLPAGRELFIYRAYLDQELGRRGDYVLDDLAKRLAEIRKRLATE
jgi:hypothetical protein